MKQKVASCNVWFVTIDYLKVTVLTVLLSCCTFLLMGQDVKKGESVTNERIRIACIGNSVTAGYGLKNPTKDAYPSQLQQLLGEKYQVDNFGLSGATLLKNGHRPYIKTESYKKALAFKPDIVVIHLGLNDTDPRDWPNYRDDFIGDYMKLIRSFSDSTGKHPAVYICRMTPIFNSHPRFKSGTRDWYWQIQEAIELISRNAQVKLIDLQKPLYNRPDLFADALHPNVEGASIIAKTVYQAITGDYEGLKLSQVFGNQMVLQRRDKIQIYGTANRLDPITVSLGTETQKCVTTSAGNWRVAFPPREAGGPYQLKISSKGQEIVLNDILIGDVWICSGQSNMQFPFSRSNTATQDLPKADHPTIRLYNLKGKVNPDAVKWDSTTLEEINRLHYFNGNWDKCSPATVKDFSAIGYYFGNDLSNELSVPIGLIQITVGGAPAEAFIDRKTLEFHPQLVDILYNWRKNDMIQDWCRERADLNTTVSKNPLQRHPFEPAYIFESGIASLKDFPVKGVIWYQGESNAHNIELNELIFPTLVKSWRKAWNKPDLPFYFAQLSSLSRPSWPSFRNSQLNMSKTIPYSGMVVTSDLGDSLDVHPTLKKEVGHRFALLALHDTYHKSVVASGPVITGVKQEKNQLILIFSNALRLKTADTKPLREMEIAGGDRIFHPVDAWINLDKVVISIPSSQTVTAVRYGWKPYSRANLVNEAGLPASTFDYELQDKQK